MNFFNSLNRPLARSNSQQWVGGVLSGIGETYNINIALLRFCLFAPSSYQGHRLSFM